MQSVVKVEIWDLQVGFEEVPPTSLFFFKSFHIINSKGTRYVELLVYVDLKNNWLVQFGDLKYKSSSNFKSIG